MGSDETFSRSFHDCDKNVSPAPYIVESKKHQAPKQVKKYNLKSRATIDAGITNRTIAFIRRNVQHKKPFFAYVPFIHPHFPTIAHPNFNGKTGNGPYADLLAEIDYRSGQILSEIDRLGIKENILVIWLSDNGPEEIQGHHGTAGYWRGNYFKALEGSLRVPAIMRWPGKIPKGTVSNEIMHMVNILPTLARVSGYQVPNDRIIDGTDQLDWLTGKQEQSNREGLPIFNGDELFAYKWRN